MDEKIILIAFGCGLALVVFIALYLNKGGKDMDEETPTSQEVGNSGSSVSQSNQNISTRSSLTDEKLDKIYDALQSLRWIGMSIAIMIALSLFIPTQCSG